MIKNRTIHMPKSIGIFSFIVLFVFLNGKLLVAQGKNEIDEKRKSISYIKDTLVKHSTPVHAIISDGEAVNITVYEYPMD
jgi:hypothetical protein